MLPHAHRITAICQLCVFRVCRRHRSARSRLICVSRSTVSRSARRGLGFRHRPVFRSLVFSSWARRLAPVLASSVRLWALIFVPGARFVFLNLVWLPVIDSCSIVLAPGQGLAFGRCQVSWFVHRWQGRRWVSVARVEVPRSISPPFVILLRFTGLTFEPSDQMFEFF
jgi:hypothetical protein